MECLQKFFTNRPAAVPTKSTRPAAIGWNSTPHLPSTLSTSSAHFVVLVNSKSKHRRWRVLGIWSHSSANQTILALIQVCRAWLCLRNFSVTKQRFFVDLLKTVNNLVRRDILGQVRKTAMEWNKIIRILTFFI